MPSASDKLHTPIYLKTRADFRWPADEPVFYLLTSDGLFLCRNHRFFRSSVRVDQWPAELAGHDSHLQLSYPRLPRDLFELVVGFFSVIGRRYGSEAAVLLVWNRTTEQVEVTVPEQVGIVWPLASGGAHPMELYYQIPPLPPHLMLIGDIHSHVNDAAYASGKDKTDEEFRPGLHLVVGRLHNEPPEFHCEVTVDGERFRVRDHETLITGYKRRNEKDVPDSWLEKVTVKFWSSTHGLYAPHQRPVKSSASETLEAEVISNKTREAQARFDAPES